MALRARANAESWFVAACFHGLAVSGVRGVVAFADPLPRLVEGSRVVAGDVGVCYQALNAVYTGRATPRTLTVLSDGSVLNERARQKVRAGEAGHQAVINRLIALGARRPQPGETPQLWLPQALRDAGAHNMRSLGCRRFVWPLGTTRGQRADARIALPALRYPKTPDPLIAPVP
jgi:hypothetical protein